MLATDNWCIKVAERVYGPYTHDQMADFVSQGRLSSQSMVAPAGGTKWREARQYPPIASLLNGDAETKTKAFGKANQKTPKTPAEGETSNFLVVFDVTHGTAGAVEGILRGLGTAFRLTDNVWVLTSTHSALGVRNAVAPHITVREPVFVVDCGRGRTTWQNFVPELQSRLMQAWVRT